MKNSQIRLFLFILLTSSGFAKISIAQDITAVNLSSASASSTLFEQTVLNNPQQQFILGSVYEYGDGVLINEAVALMWYIISNENGYEDAKSCIHKLKNYMADDQILKAQNLADNWLNTHSN